MNVLYCPDSPIIGRRWAVHRSILPHDFIPARIIVADYSMQPLAVARYAMKELGLTPIEREHTINFSKRWPQQFSDLPRLSVEYPT